MCGHINGTATYNRGFTRELIILFACLILVVMQHHPHAVVAHQIQLDIKIHTTDQLTIAMGPHSLW